MMKKEIERIGVFTSGGDAPGMNAAIRAVVRTACYHRKEVLGIFRGYRGMIEGEMEKLGARSVSNIIQRGGTILKTARSQEFFTKEGRQRAHNNLMTHAVQGLIAIGGDGTFRGAVEFHDEYGVPVIGIPATIDNDVYGTDFTIGFDTAINTALQSVDKIRDTAQSHDRVFLIEVMGRQAGFIGLAVGVSGGAEHILIPETTSDLDALCQAAMNWAKKKKGSRIIIVSEGDELGDAAEIGKKIADKTGVDFRICVLGHTQRGGAPTARERILASLLGNAAVEALLDGETDIMVGQIGDKLIRTPLRETYEKKKPIDRRLAQLCQILST
jgi:6-phosphofructokinase 1